MRRLFFDLETTGLPERRLSSYGEYFAPREFQHYNGCRIVSIAWIIFEDSSRLKESYYVIKPDGFKSSPKSLEVHKITEEFAMATGRPISEIFAEFENDVATCDQILSYNLAFDYNVFLAECWRYQQKRIIRLMDEIKQCCIMIKSKECLKTIGGVNKKYFKLEEVYRHLFNDKEFKTAHDALDDVRRCSEVFFKLGN